MYIYAQEKKKLDVGFSLFIYILEEKNVNYVIKDCISKAHLWLILNLTGILLNLKIGALNNGNKMSKKTL